MLPIKRQQLRGKGGGKTSIILLFKDDGFVPTFFLHERCEVKVSIEFDFFTKFSSAKTQTKSEIINKCVI